MPADCFRAVVVIGRQATPRQVQLRLVDVTDPQSPGLLDSVDEDVLAGGVHSRNVVWPTDGAIGVPGLREQDTMGFSVDSSAVPIVVANEYKVDEFPGMYDDDSDSSPSTGISLIAGQSLASSTRYDFSVVDFTDPTAPAVLYNQSDVGFNPRVCVVDGVVGGDVTGYTLSLQGGSCYFRQYNLDIPASPVLLSSDVVAGNQSVGGVDHIGGGFFALAWNRFGVGTIGLRIVDASTRGTASIVATVTWDTGMAGMAGCWYVGNGVLLVGGSSTLASYDVSTPSAPVFLDLLTGIVPERAVQLDDTYVAVADNSNIAGRKLAIVNVSNPSAMFVDNSLGLSLNGDVYWLDGVREIGPGCVVPGSGLTVGFLRMTS